MLAMAGIIVALVVILVIGVGKLNEIKRQLKYTQGQFSIETNDLENGQKEIFLEGDFLEGTLKVLVFRDEEKWKIKEIYLKEGSSPFRILAMDVSQPEPLDPGDEPDQSSTPSEGTDEITEIEETADNTADAEVIKSRVQGWIDAWQESNIEKFQSFYSDNFVNTITDKTDVWIQNRVDAGIFEGDPEVEVEGDIEVTFIGSDKADVKFVQNFKGLFDSRGNKFLTFTKEGDEWLITGEDFQGL